VYVRTHPAFGRAPASSLGGLSNWRLSEAQPAPDTRCPGYEAGEVEKSIRHGYLPSAVIRHASGGLLIADCAVNWRSPRPSARSAPLLQELIRAARTNPSIKIRIVGYSDCVGEERNNSVLRLGRARKVYELLQQLFGAGPQWDRLRPNIKVDAAPAGAYVADNSTAQGRAQNRGALIEHTRVVTFAPQVVETPPRTTDVEPPDFIARILQRARELFARTDRWDQFGMPVSDEQRRRILCLVDQIRKPGADDRYLTKSAVDRYDRYPKITAPEYRRPWEELLPDDVVRLRIKKTDREIWRDMRLIDEDILNGRGWINSLFIRQQSAVSLRVQSLRNWVEAQQNNDRSIYWCYRP
jgi:hypothetical protein